MIIDPSPATEHLKAEPDNKKQDSTEKPLPRFERPEWVIVYITAIYVLIAACTLWVIKRQADHMEWQAAIMEGQRTTMGEQLGAMKGQLGQMEAQTVKLGESVGVARDAANAAKQSADAAQQSADIAARVSVPTLVVSEFGLGDMGMASLEAALQYPKIKLVLKNYGQTPAFLKFWTVMFTCEDLPDIPVYIGQPGCGIHLEKVVIEPRDSYTLELPLHHRCGLSPEDIRGVIDTLKLLSVYGYVCYADLLGNRWRRLKFCETAVNNLENVGTPSEIHWSDVFGSRAYLGTDDFPYGRPIS